MMRSLMAILIGLVFLIAGMSVCFVGLSIFWPIQPVVPATQPADDSAVTQPSGATVSGQSSGASAVVPSPTSRPIGYSAPSSSQLITIQCLFAIWLMAAGFVAASIGRRHEVAHGLALGGVVIMLALTLLLRPSDHPSPEWHRNLLIAFSVPMPVLGGWMRLRIKRMNYRLRPVQLNQFIEQLTATDRKRIAVQLNEARKLVAQHCENAPLTGTPEDIELIQKIVDAGVLEPRDLYPMQCLGVAIGNILVSSIQGMQWIMIDDEFGRDPAIRFGKTTFIVYPLTMLTSRLPVGKPLVVRDLYLWICTQTSSLEA